MQTSNLQVDSSTHLFFTTLNELEPQFGTF